MRTGPDRLRVLASLLVFAALLGCDCPHVDGVQICGPTEATLPVAHPDGWPVVDGSVNGRPARLLIDTGAGGTFLSESVLGVEGAGWRFVDELCLGEICIRNVHAWAEDSEITPADPGPDRVDAVIGMNVLDAAIVEIDGGERVRVAFGGQPCSGDATPFTVDEHGRPFAPIAAQGVSFGDALLDTGALYVLMSAEHVASVGGLLDPQPAELCNLRGCRDAELGRIPELCVADFCEADLATKVPATTLVGASFFNRGRYSFDFDQARLVRCD